MQVPSELIEVPQHDRVAATMVHHLPVLVVQFASVYVSTNKDASLQTRTYENKPKILSADRLIQ